MEKWSDTAWQAAAPVYEEILRHPFLQHLADGTLPFEKFRFYLRQDALYLDTYSRVLAHIASRLSDKSHSADFVRFAQDGIDVEKAMHATFLNGALPDKSEMSPACMLYTSVQSAQATAPVETEAAAVLPCFWVYQRVGHEIVKRSVPGNPYQRWIDTYADPLFEQSTLRAIEICDCLAAQTGNNTVAAMTDIFTLCSRMEWLFWDSAWNLEKWKI